MNGPSVRGCVGGLLLLKTLVGVPLAGCAQPAGAPAPGGQDAGVLARVGATVLTLADLRGEVARQGWPGPARPVSKDLKVRLLEEMIEREALAQEAQLLGLDEDPEVKRQFDTLLAEHLLKTEFNRKVAKGIEIGREAIERYYQEHHDRYQSPEKRRVRQIFLDAPASDPARRKQAREQAKEILEQLRADPRNPGLFGQLLAEHSDDDTGKSSGGYGENQTRAQFEAADGKAVAGAVFALGKLGDFGLAQGEKGIFILRYEGNQAAVDLPLEKVASSIHDLLAAQARTDAYRAFVDGILSKLSIERYPQVAARARVETGPGAPGDQARPNSGSLWVLTDRTASHLEKIFEYYKNTYAVEIETTFVEDGLLARLESRPQEADLVFAKNADLLQIAKNKGLLQKFSSPEIMASIPPVFRDPDGTYVIVAFRPRAIFYPKDRVTLADVRDYADLTAPRWKGRVCIRSGFHEYNLSWWSQMAAAEGLVQTERFIRGLAANLARPPKGNDRAQVQGLYEDKCDLAVANSYYMGIMLDLEHQRPWAEASSVLFPDQDKLGAYVMRSGAALTTAQQNLGEATRLLEFLVSDFAQHYFAEALYEYPVKRGVGLSPVNARLGEQQGIRNGACRVNLARLDEAVKHRDDVIEILTRVNFDQK